jgi:hypothetical protein
MTVAEVSHHALLRRQKVCDIHVYHILNGPKTGAFGRSPEYHGGVSQRLFCRENRPS